MILVVISRRIWELLTRSSLVFAFKSLNIARSPIHPPQYSEAKKVIAKSHKTRSDINDYIAAVVVPLLKLKATTRTSGTLGASTSELALLGK